MVEKTCKKCRKAFNKPECVSKKTWLIRKYCSKTCYTLSMRGVKPNCTTKGMKLSEDHKKKISEAQKRIGNKPPSNLGIKHTEETKRKIGIANAIALRGKKLSMETRRKLSEAHKGEKSSSWKGGITKQNKRRYNLEYRIWREKVFTRDNYTCQFCDQYNGYLHADHIKSWVDHPELRLRINNGRTLCRACHYYLTFKRKMIPDSTWGKVKITNENR